MGVDTARSPRLLRTCAVRDAIYVAAMPSSSPRSPISWNTALVDQLDWHWTSFVRPHLEGLSDEEYLWEPVPGCWSIRRRGDASGPVRPGAGATVLDGEDPEPTPAPFTTIAWRLAHISIGVFGERAVHHFGADGRTTLHAEEVDWPITAAAGLTMLDHWYDAWIGGVRGLGEEGLERPCGPAEGPYAADPLALLVLHISREAIHHGAEVLALRDLWTHARSGTRPMTSAAS
jgi:hypothetical protein